MDNRRQQDNGRKQAFLGGLPQWNSRFGFSAQKKPQTSKVRLRCNTGIAAQFADGIARPWLLVPQAAWQQRC